MGQLRGRRGMKRRGEKDYRGGEEGRGEREKYRREGEGESWG